MRLSLHQEYCQRHNSSAKVVLYKPNTVLFLKSLNSDSQILRWQILTINHKEEVTQPSKFKISLWNMQHNGYEKENIFLDQFEPQEWYWDEYEGKILNLVSYFKLNSFKAFGFKDQVFAAWELFLFLTDSYLRNELDNSSYCFIKQSVNDDNPTKQKDFLESQIIIKKQDHKAYNLWFYNILPLAKNQENEWLVDLING